MTGSLTALAQCDQAYCDQTCGSDASDGGYVDAHAHIWTPDLTRYPLGTGFSSKDMVPQSFTAEELFAACRPSGVTRVVLIQMSFYNFDNRYMLDAIAQHPRLLSGVGIVDHHQPDVAITMKSLASKGVRGFRIHSRGQAKTWVNDEGMATLWKTAAEEGLAVCPLIDPAEIGYVDALCKKYPGAPVVVDHFARVGITGKIVPGELDQLCKLAKHPQLLVKTSAFYALGKKQAPYKDLLPMIQRLTDAFGPERLMWASDCPYQVQGDHDYESSIALLRDHANFLSADDKRWMLKKTAEKVFF
ncbi:MAG: amidohydrolase family protein [Rubripirellula sp.]|nr:amidohydrolase family protein [Rubripirellula sp.]